MRPGDPSAVRWTHKAQDASGRLTNLIFKGCLTGAAGAGGGTAAAAELGALEGSGLRAGLAVFPALVGLGANMGVWALDAGAFEAVTYDPTSREVTVTITAAPSGASGAASAPHGRLVVTQTVASTSTVLKPSPKLAQDAGAWVVPFKAGSAVVLLK